MAGTHLTFAIEDAGVRAQLAKLAGADKGDLLPRLGEYLASSTKDRFATQTDPDGAAWQALKPAYARRKKYNADKVLTLRGYLRGGIHYQPDGADAVLVGTNSKYGAVHQFGGTIEQPARQATVRYRSVAGKILFAGKKHKRATEKNVTIGTHQVKIPARPFLGISNADDARINEILRQWHADQLQG